MGAFVIANQNEVGYAVWADMFASHLDNPVRLDGQNAAGNMARFAATTVLNQGKVVKVAGGLSYFEQGILCCDDHDRLFSNFEVYVQNIAWLKVEPYIEMGIIERTPSCDVRAYANVNVDYLSLSIVSKYKYFVYGVDSDGASHVVALFGMLEDEAKAFLTGSN